MLNLTQVRAVPVHHRLIGFKSSTLTSVPNEERASTRKGMPYFRPAVVRWEGRRELGEQACPSCLQPCESNGSCCSLTPFLPVFAHFADFAHTNTCVAIEHKREEHDAVAEQNAQYTLVPSHACDGLKW